MSDAHCAPVRGRVAAALLAAIFALAALVCALHWVNAVTLRGAADLSAYTPFEEDEAVALVEEAREERGVLLLSGALMHPGRGVGEVRVRAALLPLSGGRVCGEMTLLNTQMVRRYDLAEAYGCDDHCGFAAAAACRLLGPGEYALALADESDGTKRLAVTDLTLTLGDGGALVRVEHGGGDA